MSKKRIYARYLLILLALVGLALLSSGGAAAAHNELIGSDPPDGAEVATGPARVSLTFDLPVQRGFSTVTVTGPGGIQWQAGAPAEAGAVVSAPVRPLGPAGQYTIAYQVLSADSHPVRGAVRFTLTTAGTGAVAALPPITDRSGITPPGTATQTRAGSNPGWPWLVGAGVVLVAGVAVALRVRRSS
ncbi:MAG: copper resistance CopC family protein [Pseudonocardiaceae bacterium]